MLLAEAIATFTFQVSIRKFWRIFWTPLTVVFCALSGYFPPGPTPEGEKGCLALVGVGVERETKDCGWAHLCDLPNTVWVSWSKPGCLLTDLFTGTRMVLGGDTSGGEGWQKQTLCPAKARKGQIFPLSRGSIPRLLYCSHEPACTARALSAAVPCITRERRERQQRTAGAWAPKTCIPLWHNAATVEDDIRNKKQSLKLQEQAARIIKKNIKMMPLKPDGDSIKYWKENV